MAELYSNKFKRLNYEQGSPDIKSAIFAISSIAVRDSVELFSFKKNIIGISFKLSIDLPSRGTVNNIDIREIEPLFLLVDADIYPYKAPLVFSDRMDFPSEKLPHLNPWPKGYPANLCLHRGNTDEWFVEHTLEEYILRIKDWLRDAARNRLIKKDQLDEFEITRINESYGYNIYNPQKLIDLIDYNHNANYAFLWYEIIQDDLLINTEKSHYSIKYVFKINSENVDKVIELSKEINDHKQSSKEFNKRAIGIFLYPPESKISERYFTNFPSKYEEFEEWCINLHLDIKEVVKIYLESGYHLLGGIPISIAIRRPQGIINSNSNIEILNFVINAGGDYWPTDSKIHKDSKVLILENRKPVDLNFAKEISSQRKDIFKRNSIFIGCGAVGSKLILHMSKSGLNNYEIIDSDTLSPHNLVRHALFANSSGKNKAESLTKEIQKIFYTDETNLNISYSKSKGENYLNSLTKTRANKISTIIDTTASNSFQMFLSDYNLPNTIKCIRCEIAFNGKLGILKIEGENRTPRLDDLNMYLIDQAIDNEFVSSWLRDFRNKREKGGFEFEEINIGVSCNSNTLKLSDDIISLHTSYFSFGIKRSSNSKKGEIHLTMLSEKSIEPLTSKRIQINEVNDLRFKNDSDWRLRIGDEISKSLFKELKNNKPNETGGLLIGKVDVKRKIIYVTRFTKAPSDSIKKPYLFERGKKDVPEIINSYREKTGGLIDYVGEWHTHPTGSSKPSQTDFTAVKELRSILDKIPYPTFIIIVTPTRLNPYIFGPKILIH
ncbi:MAG: Mov34/MPN/PAD-1 family protein [Bacteroidetes bacterium]|nr:Mov34/MPN/PAD-1 family protein [Bacteroidota bacterium]